MGFVNYLKSLLTKNVLDEENNFKEKEIENTKPIHSKKCDQVTSKNRRSSNLVSTTTTTIINRKRVSKIVKSSYVKNKTNGCQPSFRYYRIASPIAESSSLYSQPSDQRNLKIQIENNKLHPLVHFHRDVLERNSNNFLINVPKMCKNRDDYSTCMQYEIIKKNSSTYANKFKIKKRKRRIDDLRIREKSAYEFVKTNQAPPCCIINGKPLKLKKTSASFFEQQSVLKNRKMQKIEKIHLKKSKAMSDIKRIEYFTNRGMKSRMSSTLNTNASLSTLVLGKKRSTNRTPKLSQTKHIIQKNLKSAINQAKKDSNNDKVFCSTFIVDFSSTPVKMAPKTSTPIKLHYK